MPMLEHGKWSLSPLAFLKGLYVRLRALPNVRPTTAAHLTYVRSVFASWRIPFLPGLFEVNLRGRIRPINTRRSENKLHLRVFCHR